MQRFLSFLFENPLVAIVLVGWLLGLGAKALKGSGAAQRQQPPARPQQSASRQRPAPPAMQRRPAAPAAPARGRQGPTAEEVAAEMRRILGMDPPGPSKSGPAPGPAQQIQPRSVARSASPPRQSSSVEVPAQVSSSRSLGSLGSPGSPGTLGTLGTRIDPHVGERLESRRGPMSGAVGRSSLGGLGGRSRSRVGKSVRTGSRLVDTHDMVRAIVMREILDKPLGLRGLD